MRNIILIVIALFFVRNLNAQEENQEHIERIVDVFYKIDTANLILKNVLPVYSKLDSTDILYELIYGNYNYSYSLLSYSIRYSPQEIKISSMKDIEPTINKLKKTFINKLLSNKDYMYSIDYYLKYKMKIENIVRDSIELGKLIDIASKYYYVYKIENDSSIKFSFCGGGANPYLLQPELSTNIIAESFAFNALGRLLGKRDFALIMKLNAEIEPLLQDTLTYFQSDISPDVKLALFRKITWEEMKKDERIKDALVEESKLSKNIIPLRIIY